MKIDEPFWYTILADKYMYYGADYSIRASNFFRVPHVTVLRWLDNMEVPSKSQIADIINTGGMFQ